VVPKTPAKQFRDKDATIIEKAHSTIFKKIGPPEFAEKSIRAL
jgi:hypothetical protein